MSIYRRLGVEPIINASGPVTRLGGAPMPDVVLQAMDEAAREAVPVEQLQLAASRQIAELTGAEAGIVTAGAAAGLTLATAAVLARLDPARMQQLPNTDGMPSEVIVAREQRSGYDHAVRAAGAQLVEVGFNEVIAGAGVRRTEAWEIAAAISPRTAALLYVLTPDSRPSLEEVVGCAREHHLPVIVDAAGQLPPRANLTAIPASGADLVVFSGGKAIQGPQSTGILCGRRELVASAALQMLDMDDHFGLWQPPQDWLGQQPLAGLPRHGLGRGFKVAKEQIAGLLVALQQFANADPQQQYEQWRERLDLIQNALAKLPVECRLVHDRPGDHVPLLEITCPASPRERTATEICRRLRHSSPAIYVGHGQLDRNQLVVQPLCLSQPQAELVAHRLRELLQ